MEDGMKKQVLWKQVLWKVVVFGAALLTASGAVGQAHQNDAITEIPFAFAVASQPLPAGRYTVTRMNDTLLRISNSHNERVIVLTTKVESKAREDMAKMVFPRYGDSYFLAELWVAGSETGRKVFPSRAEDELIRKRTEMAIAVLQVAR
jgi:hypothetical protein